jgi:hypothetical protein
MRAAADVVWWQALKPCLFLQDEPVMLWRRRPLHG